MRLVVPDDLQPSPDLDVVRQALGLLVESGQRFELRALPSGRSWVGDDIDAAVEAARSLVGGNLYYTLNPCRHDLDGAAKNGDITERRWLFLDIDPRRSDPDVMATEEEKQAAAELAEAVRFDLKMRGWPDPIVIDSGNGFHLLYRIDLPNNKAAQAWISAFLRNLGSLFDTDGAHVDLAVHNAARIARLPGTWTRKGKASAERPFRMARLVSIPRELGVVPPDLIRAMATPEKRRDPAPDDVSPPAPGPTPSSTFRVPPMPDKDLTGWFKKALENEAAQVILAEPGTRHNRLRAAARTLAGHLHHGHLDEAEVVRTLKLAGQRAGLDDKDIGDVIGWGIADGKANPLPLAEKLRQEQRGSNGTGTGRGWERVVPEPEAPPEGVRLIVRASEIIPRKVEYLWPGRIPLGKLTTFAGRGGLGKTFVLCDIAARVSRGDEWPDSGGECAECGQVLFISGEDEPDDTLVPRLIEMGADLERIVFLTTECQDRFTLADLPTLDAALEQMGPNVRFVAIDPPTAYLGGVDDHKNAELRGLLSPLKNWAARHRLALVFNTHVNKGAQNVEAAARVMGSVAWVNAVRSAYMFAPDPEDKARRLFVGMKINVGKERKGLAYRIVETDSLAKVEWLGEVDTTADEALNREKRKPRVKSATEWLVEIFRQQQEWPSDLFWASARENGITKYAIDEAKVKLDMPRARRTVGTNGDVAYTWWVPLDWPYLRNDPAGFNGNQRSANRDENHD
jgi:putative DNA primase/helicase